MKALLQINDLRFLNRGPYNIVLHEKQIICLSGASRERVFCRAICDLEPSDGAITLKGRNKNEIRLLSGESKVT